MTAAVVVVRVTDQRHQAYVYRGAILPPSIAEGEAERLLERGMVVSLDLDPEPVPEPDAEPAKPARQPKGAPASE